RSFVFLRPLGLRLHGEEPSPELYAEVRNWVRKEIGPLATPDVLHWTDSLPKTRSGKIMRRILRKIAAGDTSKSDRSHVVL
ncbi:AMP-binding enzyme, partial [Enterobacter asburiae]